MSNQFAQYTESDISEMEQNHRWAAGDSCFARDVDGKFYAADVVSLAGGTATVAFVEGPKELSVNVPKDLRMTAAVKARMQKLAQEKRSTIIARLQVIKQKIRAEVAPPPATPPPAAHAAEAEATATAKAAAEAAAAASAEAAEAAEPEAGDKEGEADGGEGDEGQGQEGSAAGDSPAAGEGTEEEEAQPPAKTAKKPVEKVEVTIDFEEYEEFREERARIIAEIKEQGMNVKDSTGFDLSEYPQLSIPRLFDQFQELQRDLKRLATDQQQIMDQRNEWYSEKQRLKEEQDRVLEELAIKSVKRVDEHAVTMAELEAGHEERMDELNRTWEQRIRQADGELQRLRKKLKMHQRAGQDLVEENEREEKMYQEKIAKLREELKVKGGQTSKNDTQFEQHLPNALMATLSMENEKMKKIIVELQNKLRQVRAGMDLSTSSSAPSSLSQTGPKHPQHGASSAQGTYGGAGAGNWRKAGGALTANSGRSGKQLAPHTMGDYPVTGPIGRANLFAQPESSNRASEHATTTDAFVLKGGAFDNTEHPSTLFPPVQPQHSGPPARRTNKPSPTRPRLRAPAPAPTYDAKQAYGKDLMGAVERAINDGEAERRQRRLEAAAERRRKGGQWAEDVGKSLQSVETFAEHPSWGTTKNLSSPQAADSSPGPPKPRQQDFWLSSYDRRMKVLEEEVVVRRKELAAEAKRRKQKAGADKDAQVQYEEWRRVAEKKIDKMYAERARWKGGKTSPSKKKKNGAAEVKEVIVV